MTSATLKVSDQVRKALHAAERKPVVALECAIYTHGFPYPDNVALTSRLQSVVRTMHRWHECGRNCDLVLYIRNHGLWHWVHRGGEGFVDVKADLTELGRCPGAVVSSECKSFLDIQRTLEYSKTYGVAIARVTEDWSYPIDLPGFWSTDSGVRSPCIIQNET